MRVPSRNRMFQHLALAATLATAFSFACSQPEAPPGKIIPVNMPDGEWRGLGRDNTFQRYAPLDQINRDNVGQLKVAWRWSQENFGPSAEFYAQPVPIYVAGTLYTTAGLRRSAAALDPVTGETLWTYRPEEGERWENAPRKTSGRGVTFWTDGQGDNRVFYVTRGYYLVGLNADNGQPAKGFGNNGMVDMFVGWRGADPVGNVGSTTPPTIVGDVVIVGPSLAPGFRPKSKTNSPGDVTAYDVRTGKLLWKFKTVPDEGELGADTWEQNSKTYTGNTGVWSSISADDALGLIYLPVEAPTNDYYGGHRLGDNLFANSLVCLDAKTGERKWHYQIVHHDIWDYDNPAAPIIADVTIAGQPRKIVIQNTKHGYTYVFDRITGEPVWPFEEKTMAASDVPGERSSPTQPIPSKPPAFETQGVTPENLVDFTPAIRAKALEVFKQYRMGPLFTPPSLASAPDGTKGTIQVPGANGGVNWNMTCFDPETGVNFIPSNTSISLLALRKPEADESDMDLFSAGLRAPDVEGIPIVKPPWGRIVAVDMNTGDHKWMVANGDTPKNIKEHPLLKGVDIPKTGKANRFGSVVTKTLLFVGEGYSGDPFLHAYDKETGALVASIPLPAAQSGMLMSYMHNGKQYIVMTCGAQGFPAELVALALPDEKKAGN